MSASTRSALVVAAVVWVLVTATGVVTVYLFDYYERAWGRGGSTQVYAWIATVSALLSAFGSGLGFHLGSRTGRVPGPFGAVAVGVVVVGILCAAVALVPTQLSGADFLVAACLVVVAVAASFLSCKLGVRRAV
jgi:MFS family permease